MQSDTFYEDRAMHYRTSFTLALLTTCLTYSGFAISRADTTTTTTEITTTGGGIATVNLSSRGDYQVVDPITGNLIGKYNPTVRLVEGRPLQAGVVIVDNSNGSLVATVDSNGNIVDIGRAPASQTLVVSIDERRRDLNRRIDEALSKGLLTATQAASYQAELERITADEDAARQNAGLNYGRALQLGYGLNTLSDRLVPITQTVTLSPVISTQFVTVDGKIVMIDGITSRKQRMARRIDDEYAAGRLSSQQVSHLKQDLDRITSFESQYRKNGVLSNSKDRKVSEKLDKVQASIDEDVAYINQKRSRIGLRTD
jgi:hypothetical protein